MDKASGTGTDSAEQPALGKSRTLVLRALQTASGPLGVEEIASRVGLHANSTRFHLDGLLEQGLIERVSDQRGVPGRPRSLYVAAPDSIGLGQRNFRLLAEILTHYLATHAQQPGEAALEAGQAWGRQLAGGDGRRTSGPAATRRVVAALEDIGFEPELVPHRRTPQILLHHCPFREAAADNREVVCGIHLGLMQGMLSSLDAPMEAQRLDAFVEPSLCIAQLAATGTGSPTPGRKAG